MNKDQIDAYIAQAKAALERGILVGHVMVTQIGDDLNFRCTSCKAEETVKSFYDGGRPERFTYFPTMMDGREYVKCETCGKVHDRIVPGAK